MPRLPYGLRLAPAHRPVVAMTCAVCGQLKPGVEFERRPRLPGGPPYLDRRCRPCRWARMESNPGR